MTYRLTKSWPDPHMQRLAEWTRDMMDASGVTAAQIGCSKEAIIAQAALETAWGAAAIGHNLFGIKADASWTGPTRIVPTEEVVNGQTIAINAAFRDYPSYAGSIADHFKFLRDNSRYAAAGVFNAGSDQAYFEALQRAGYATDPNYARSLMNMLASVKMFTACMVDEQPSAAIEVKPLPPPPPAILPPGYVQQDGNVILADIKDSTIIKGSNQGAIVATAGTVASVGTAAASFAGLDWKVLAVLGGIGIAAGVLAIVYFVLIKGRRIDMHDRGIA